MINQWGANINWDSNDAPSFVQPGDDVLILDPASGHRTFADIVEWSIVRTFCLEADHVHYYGRGASVDNDEPGDEITLMNEHGRISLQLDGNTTTGDAVAMYCQILLGLTYGQGSIIDALREVAEELEA